MEYKDMLCELLNCGILDIEMIKECRYSFDDIKEDLKNRGVNMFEFNDILDGAISIYQAHIQRAIDSRIYDLECDIKDMELWYDDLSVKVESEDKVKWDRLWTAKEELEELSAFDDIEYFINYLDTSIYINDDEKRKLYKKHLQDIIDEENEEIGFVSLEVE